MFRKLIITESEKKQISSLHNILNEVENFASFEGVVYDSSKTKVAVPDTKIVLKQNGNVVKETTSDSNGKFFIDKIELGTYDLQYSHTRTDLLEVTIPITFYKKEKVVRNIYFSPTKDVETIKVSKKVQRLTMIDVEVLDTDGKPLGPCKIQIFDKDGIEVLFSPNTTDNNGELKNISLNGEMNENFKTVGEPYPWDASTSILLKATYGNVSNQKQYEVKLNNGVVIKDDGKESNQRIYRKDEETEEVVFDLTDTNKLKINIEPLLNYRINVKDGNSDEVLKTAIVSIFSDKDNTKLLSSGLSPLVGSVKREKLEDSEDLGFENSYKVFYLVTNEGYKSKTGRFNFTTKKTNSFEVSLDKIVIKPPKEINERGCIRLTKQHYRNMQKYDAGDITLDVLGGVEGVKETALDVKNCLMKYRKTYPNRMKKFINRLMNVQADLDFFEIKTSNQENKDIYGESRTMSLKNTIKQVVSESVKIKNLSTEKNLVEQRLRFSLKGSSTLNESKRRLRNERYKLINFGYDKELVRESFLDVMKGLYGNEGTDVISDIKTRLGQRIADQVKNKQEEHEMILSAFNDLPTEMIERAIKENRVDELSNEIATKALENYKTQFGTEGLSGIMFASVDETKFKQEVSKLIEPAIKDITTKMDEKLKQVQDAVSGGLNPTA